MGGYRSRLGSLARRWRWMFAIVAASASLPVQGRQASPVSPPQSLAGVRVQQLTPRFHVISDQQANLLLYVGDVTLVAGVQRPALVQAAQATLRELKAAPVKYAVLTEDGSAPSYRDGGWGREGATTLAHELFYVRMRDGQVDPASVASGRDPALPAITFSRVVQLWIPGEETHLVRERAGYSDADVIVHFEDSGVLYLGSAFTNDSYPTWDESKGGKLSGLVDTASFFVQNFAQIPEKVEPVIPGRGAPATLDDLRAFRDMLVTVRERVRALVQKGATRDTVLAAKPSADFDARWGSGAGQPAAFVNAVYQAVTTEKAPAVAAPAHTHGSR
jgi:cyclase